ncbi:hypothetical protein D3C84_229290 [compost metagenome]
MGDFRYRLDQPVGLLQQLRGLLRRQAGQGRGHIEQVALVQRRQELAAQLRQRPQGAEKHQCRDRQGGLGPRQYRIQRRLVDADQPAVQRVARLIGNPPANPVAHQHRHQGHRQPRGGGHGIGLGEGQRAEQPAFLGLQGEHRNERQGDDQQAEEQRRADFHRRIGNHPPVLGAFELLAGMRLAPGLDLLVRVLDHHHRGVDHGADGDGDTAERHDVGVDALLLHDGEGDQHADRQGHYGHQRGTQVPEEGRADQRDHDELLHQLLAEVAHRAVDQLAAVVGGDDLHPVRQAAFQFLEFGLDRIDGAARVLAAAQDHHAADHLALAVQFGDAATHLRPQLDMRHLAEGHRHAAGIQAQRDGAKVVEGFQITRGAHHELGFRQFQHRAAGFLVGPADGVRHLGLGDAQAGQLDRVELHLVLLDHAADGRHLGDVGQGLQLELEEPVLQRAQLRQVMLTAAVDQGVLVDPADPGGVRPQRRFGAGRQAALDLAEVFQHPRTRPVEVGVVLEQHIDEAVAEERVAAHGLRPRYREHGGGQRIGHLVLDDLRRLARIGRADDHLHVGQVRQRIDGRVLQRPDAPGGGEQGRQQHQETIGHRPADQRGDHGCAS